MEDLEKEIKKVFSGDEKSIAKFISEIENESKDISKIKKLISPHLGSAFYLGITGPPGVGKSTLIDKLIPFMCKDKFKVGIIAVDPSSPFTGGAILGDRVRMQEHFTKKNVFIRSMATRGNLGGLAKRTKEAGEILEAGGYNLIIFETIGVGQIETEVVQKADLTIFVIMPGLGDGIQSLKAGLIEAVDIIVINKCEKEGAEELKNNLEISLSSNKKKQKIFLTQAIKDIGIEELWKEVRGRI